MSNTGKGFNAKIHKVNPNTIRMSDPDSPIHGIRDTVSVMTKLEALAYLNSRVSVLREDVELFGETVEATIALMALGVVISETKNAIED